VLVLALLVLDLADLALDLNHLLVGRWVLAVLVVLVDQVGRSGLLGRLGHEGRVGQLGLVVPSRLAVLVVLLAIQTPREQSLPP